VADAAALAAALAGPPAARHAAESLAVAHGLALDALAWRGDDGRTVVVCVRAQAARACAAARRTLPS
jgi:outer membrane lipoprotein SlyB